jgi:hypothetical protein
LAVYWAHQVADQFPDGQLYVNLRGFDPSGSVMAPAEAVRRFLDAITSYHHALKLHRDLGDRYSEATALTHLGDTHYATGTHHAAQDAWQQALTILDELQHPDAERARGKLTDCFGYIDPSSSR